MIKVLNWLTKEPFYRLGLLSVVTSLVIAQAEGRAYWVAGVYVVVMLFLLGYARWFKN